MNGLPKSEFIVFAHRDTLLIEMTEEYVIYCGELRALRDCGTARLYEDD